MELKSGLWSISNKAQISDQRLSSAIMNQSAIASAMLNQSELSSVILNQSELSSAMLNQSELSSAILNQSELSIPHHVHCRYWPGWGPHTWSRINLPRCHRVAVITASVYRWRNWGSGELSDLAQVVYVVCQGTEGVLTGKAEMSNG